MKTKTKKTNITAINPEQFEEMTSILAEFSRLTNRLGQLENAINHQFLVLLKDNVKNYSSLQAAITEAEKQIKTIASRNPQWFERPTLKTPFGTVKQTSGTSLVTDNEELSITLVEREAEIDKEFKADSFIRQKKELAREALEKLPDTKLQRFGIRRETKTEIKVTAANVDMGKAVEEAIAQDQAA